MDTTALHRLVPGSWPRLSDLATRSRGMTTAVAAALSLLTLAALLTVMHRHDVEEHTQKFESDFVSAASSVNLHLRANAKFAHLLASEYARGSLDRAAFHVRASEYLAENPAITHLFLKPGPDAPVWVATAPSHAAGDASPERLESVPLPPGLGRTFVPRLGVAARRPTLELPTGRVHSRDKQPVGAACGHGAPPRPWRG